jgi:hypothetical protein
MLRNQRQLERSEALRGHMHRALLRCEIRGHCKQSLPLPVGLNCWPKPQLMVAHSSSMVSFVHSKPLEDFE